MPVPSHAALMEAEHVKASMTAQRMGVVNVWRGMIWAKKMEIVRPHPPLRPRSEQYARWPRQHRPVTEQGWLPFRRLWRLSVLAFPQKGHRYALSEKHPGPALSAPSRRGMVSLTSRA